MKSEYHEGLDGSGEFQGSGNHRGRVKGDGLSGLRAIAEHGFTADCAPIAKKRHTSSRLKPTRKASPTNSWGWLASSKRARRSSQKASGE